MSFTKHTCDECGGKMIVLSSLSKLLCADCKHYQPWELKKGQKSVLIEGQIGDGYEPNISTQQDT